MPKRINIGITTIPLAMVDDLLPVVDCWFRSIEKTCASMRVHGQEVEKVSGAFYLGDIICQNGSKA